ncbi:MAG: 3-deoxy-D-manno-octulosonic acid transferase [Bacteroidales bacterium]
MHFLYNLALRIYVSGIRLASFFNPKANIWLRGRKEVWDKLKNNIHPHERWIWFHCASLGEFEQGRPVIERVRKEAPEFKILLTFFSPSGYEIRKNYTGVDLVTYLPADFPSNAQRFIHLVNPRLAVFVKYEFWINYLLALQRNDTPTYLISGIFRPSQHFFKWYGAFFRKGLSAFNHFYVQNETSVKLLESLGFHNITLSGDTRFDRVVQQVAYFEEIPLLQQWAPAHQVIVGGSLWPADFELLLPFIRKHPEYSFILVPHEPEPARLRRMKDRIGPNARLWSESDPDTIRKTQVIIVDTVGLLSRIYRYAAVAYIGGGFGAGIHNILEAAAYGKPVIFGPNHKKFVEALELIEREGAKSISDANGLEEALLHFVQSQNQGHAGHICKSYVESHAGATEIIVKDLLNQLRD